MSGFAVLDFETTGFIPERNDRVVEIGLVLVDDSGASEGSWSTLVNPRRDIGASHVHGISAGDVLEAPEFPEIGDHLLSLLEGRTVVAHNASFDMRFLHRELLRSGYRVDERPPALCSMKCSGRLLGPAKLEHCCEALGIPLTNAHSALGDAEATAQFLAHLHRRAHDLPEWHADRDISRRFEWPGPRGRSGSTRSVTRSQQSSSAPGSWMASIIADTWVPGIPEDEAAYLVALGNALLDSSISVSEGKQLVEVAERAGISATRMSELHLAHLHSLAAEAWSDGVLTDDERTDLCSAAAAMGLTEEHVASALEATRNRREIPKQALLHSGDRVVFTGTLNKSRDQWITEIVAAGLATGGITKSTRVVVADADSLSGKASKARSNGVPVIDERAFAKHFGEYLGQG